MYSLYILMSLLIASAAYVNDKEDNDERYS